MEFDASRNNPDRNSDTGNLDQPDELDLLIQHLFTDFEKKADESFESVRKGLYHAIMFELSYDSNT